MADDKPRVPRPRPLGVDASPPDYNRSFTIEEFHRSQRESRRNQPHPVEMLVGSWLFDEAWRTLQREGIEGPTDVGPVELPDATECPEPQEDISVFLVVTGVRVAWDELPVESWYEDYWQHPEYEVEGWLLNPPGNPETRVWVLCKLKTTDTEQLDECTLYLLNPGEERGTEPTPGVF